MKKVIKRKIFNHEWMLRDNSTNDDGILAEVFRDKTYNLNYVLGDVKTIVDIGGHVGGFTVKALQKFKDAKCYTFEPMGDNFKLLTENVKAFGDRAKVFNLAVCGDRVPVRLEFSNLEFEWGQVNTGSNIYSYEKSNDSSIKNIHINKLQDDIGEIDLLKIDCEGGENSIFENLDFSRVKYIFCELHEYGSIIGNDATIDMVLGKGFEIMQHNYINDKIQDFIMCRG